MSDQISDEARREVNDAIANAGSTVVGQLVDTGNSSKRKRKEAREKREEKERREKDEEEKSKASGS